MVFILGPINISTIPWTWSFQWKHDITICLGKIIFVFNIPKWLRRKHTYFILNIEKARIEERDAETKELISWTPCSS
ncbi:TPA_asm: hypothetical protein vir520_00026 [Caudoviricetes sp. vir520]|nr:TPA_asm: hypothetical protein vir520_00026 [Caudoviricetes sp. vir520]